MRNLSTPLQFTLPFSTAGKPLPTLGLCWFWNNTIKARSGGSDGRHNDGRVRTQRKCLRVNSGAVRRTSGTAGVPAASTARIHCPRRVSAPPVLSATSPQAYITDGCGAHPVPLPPGLKLAWNFSLPFARVPGPPATRADGGTNEFPHAWDFAGPRDPRTRVVATAFGSCLSEFLDCTGGVAKGL